MSSFQNRYKVLQKIGEGSFSEVLKCQHRQTGEYYAAKRLKKSYKSKEDVRNCAEIIAAQKIPHHPNILNLLDYHYETFSGKAVLIFELMDMSMYDMLKNRTRRVPESRVKYFLYQILKGLTHLQNHGLFHRDVKPENILIKMTPSGEWIKLGDLGSVRGIYSEPPYTEYISTRWYRSPECLLSAGNYGPKMDVWATGCVFYEMLTLKPLFPGNDELDQLHKIHGILGTPNVKLLDKIRKRSRNCSSFPEINGTGLYPLMNNFSEHARRLLKLMLEYDPDKRINARRLLQSVYFDSIRFRENHLRDNAYYKKLKLNQNSGDKKSLENKSNPNVQKPKSKVNCKLETTQQQKKEVTKARDLSKSRKAILNVSQTLLDVASHSKSKVRSKENKSSDSKISKAWKPKPSIVTFSDDGMNDKYRKTISNLTQFTKPLITQKEIEENRQFCSKSFVPSGNKMSSRISSLIYEEKTTKK